MDISIIDKNIRSVYNTGKVKIGIRESKNSIMNGEGKLIIIANDCPMQNKNDINYLSEMSQIPVKIYPQSAMRLGETCGRPHPISVLVVINEGDSKILEIFE